MPESLQRGRWKGLVATALLCLFWAAGAQAASPNTAPPGPNNPVGVYWLGLSKPHWGIHGTPEPAHVGRSESNGCIHLTNWDVLRVAQVVKVGFVVEVHA